MAVRRAQRSTSTISRKIGGCEQSSQEQVGGSRRSETPVTAVMQAYVFIVSLFFAIRSKKVVLHVQTFVLVEDHARTTKRINRRMKYENIPRSKRRRRSGRLLGPRTAISNRFLPISLLNTIN